MTDEVKILNSPKDFDSPQVEEPKEEPVATPPQTFDELRWQLSQ